MLQKQETFSSCMHSGAVALLSYFRGSDKDEPSLPDFIPHYCPRKRDRLRTFLCPLTSRMKKTTKIIKRVMLGTCYTTQNA